MIRSFIASSPPSLGTTHQNLNQPVAPLASSASPLFPGLTPSSDLFKIYRHRGIFPLLLFLLVFVALFTRPLWILILVPCISLHIVRISKSNSQASAACSPRISVQEEASSCTDNEMSKLSVWLATGAFELLLGFLKGGGVELWAAMCLKRKCISRVQNVEDDESFSLLDLPDLAIEEILIRLPPDSLCQMAGVCKQLRDKSRSNHLWEPLLKSKWGKIAGPAAYREWQCTVARHPNISAMDHVAAKALVWPFSCMWPFFLLKSKVNGKTTEGDPPADSLMAWYWALETGTFWFPAQVYNREHGHVGFLLSCYDAELSYDRRTDTFRARYPPHGSRTVVIEEDVQWERLRAPPVDTPAHELHVSDCLNELRPGDHVEVQWRRNKDFPYGWWYGVVGHLEMCDRESRHCRCYMDDTVWLEFNHYTLGSRWRRAAVNRRTHREAGNEAEGFYAGIRKLCTNGEISTWKQLWPNETLE